MDARLVGSFGRAASLEKDPITYKRAGGQLRDFDIFIVNRESSPAASEVTKEAATIVSPFNVEQQYSCSNISYQENGTSTLSYRKNELAVNSKVVELYPGLLYGVTVPTFRPQTLFHLPVLYGSARPKDFTNLLSFGREIEKSGETISSYEYEVFHRLIDLRNEKYPLDKAWACGQWIYMKHVPETYQNILRPVLGPLKKRYKEMRVPYQ